MDASLAERLQASADAVSDLARISVAVDQWWRGSRVDVGENAPKPGEPMAALRASRREWAALEPSTSSWRGAGRRDLPSRPLVPLLPHQHPRACRSA